MATQPLIDSERLRSSVTQTAEKLRANPEGDLIRPWVETRLVRDVSVEARFDQFGREFVFRSDEPAGRGGQGDAPTAIRYFLSGIAFCLQVWYAKGAALTGCELHGLTLRLEAALDMRGEYRLPHTSAAQYLIATAMVESPSSRDLVRLVERSVPIHVRLHHNGELIRDALPRDEISDPSVVTGS